MATTRMIWVSVDGDWVQTGSWHGAKIPVASDRLHFRGANSQQDLTTLPTGTYIVDLDLLQTDPDYEGDIATSGSPLDISADLMMIRGTGTLWLSSTSGKLTDWLIVNSINGTNAANLNGAEITNIIVVAGNVTISAGLTADFNLYVDGPSARVTIEAGAGSTGSTVTMTAGKCTSNIDLANARIHGGELIQETVQIANIECDGGAVRFNFRDVTDSNAEISGTVNVAGNGLVDFTGNPLTLNIVGDLILRPGGRIKQFVDQVTVDGQKVSAGGTVEDIS